MSGDRNLAEGRLIGFPVKGRTERDSMSTKDYEGFFKRATLEKGGRKPVMTVGSGINVEEKHNIKLLPKDVVEGKREITKKEDDKAYKANRKIADSDSRKYLGDSYDKLDKGARETIIDMHYNMGGPRMSKFKGLQKAAKKQDYGRMADEIRYRNADTKKEETPYWKQTKSRAKAHYKKLNTLALRKRLGDETARQLER